MFKNDLRHGKGAYVYPGKKRTKRHTYKGYYNDDLKSGKGTEVWANGQKY